MKRQVLVIKTEELFPLIGGYFQGFSALPAEILTILDKSCHWMDKDAAEKNPAFKQIIGYAALLSPRRKIFTYQRAKKKEHYDEVRLMGKWSIGVGGHVEWSLGKESISSSIDREINEEVETFGGIQELRLIGGINDDTDSVGQVHFGILLAAITSSERAKPKSDEIASGEFRSFIKISRLFEVADAEGWSRICLPHIPLTT